MEWVKMTVRQIKEAIGGMDEEEKGKALKELLQDDRSGVREVAIKIEKSIENHQREILRIKKIKIYENTYFKKGAIYIAGIDEVGRGPLAGPVYASAVIFPAECIIEGINDSKKLSSEKRENLYFKIKESAIAYATGTCDVETIDSINILNATYMAMREALEKLRVKPNVLLNDAVRIPGIDIFQVPIIKGDSKSFSIAAASIVAKVERDKFMDEIHKMYPVYNFLQNKGYGTKEHIDAIKKYGICPFHRKSFLKGII